MPPSVAEVGSTANNYQILAKLAAGGMAEIFLARGASVAGVERYVVLKRILRERATDTHFVQMFLEEARLAAQLNHPNVAQVYDVGKLGDSYFFTMEYVHGETVRGLLQRARALRRELPLGVILTVIANAAAGLHHAHDRIGVDGRPLGIVHRDISPSNLMISYEGSVKVVDFGVAKAENRAQETRSGAVKGKISYLSPEQCRGNPLDRRSDLFSLGIVFWEMLTTERLYKRGSDFDNMSAIVAEQPPAPSTRRPNLPREIDALVLRLLAKSADDRFQNADDVIEAIEQVASTVGAQLSASALGRFMRELFGQRPEPWVELEHRDAAEGVTVTSEPLPADLAAQLDPANLGHVPDHSGPASASGNQPRLPSVSAATEPIKKPAHGAPVEDLLATIPHERAVPAAHAEPRPTVPMKGPVTIPVSIPPPPANVPSPYAGTGSSPSIAPSPYAGTGSAPSLASPPAAYAGTGVPTSGSMPSMSAYPSASSLSYPSSAPVEPAPRRSKGPLIAVLVGASLVGVGIAVVATREESSSPQPQAGASSARDAASAADEPATADAASVVATAPTDATVAVDPAEAVAPADAAEEVAAVPIDAAAPVVAVDAGVAKRPDPPTVSRGDKIERAAAAGRSGEVVRLCADGVDRPHLCTLAACEEDQASKARAWFARVASSRRASVLAGCKSAGIDLAPKRPPAKPDCLADPMACQR